MKTTHLCERLHEHVVLNKDPKDKTTLFHLNPKTLEMSVRVILWNSMLFHCLILSRSVLLEWFFNVCRSWWASSWDISVCEVAPERSEDRDGSSAVPFAMDPQRYHHLVMFSVHMYSTMVQELYSPSTKNVGSIGAGCFGVPSCCLLITAISAALPAGATCLRHAKTWAMSKELSHRNFNGATTRNGRPNSLSNKTVLCFCCLSHPPMTRGLNFYQS